MSETERHADDIQVGEWIEIDGSWRQVASVEDDEVSGERSLFIEGDPTAYEGTYNVRPEHQVREYDGLDSMNEGIKEVPCPECSVAGHLKVEVKWIAADPPASLAGMQMKTSARPWPMLTCGKCGFEKAASRSA